MIVFWLFVARSVASAVFTVTAKKPVYSVVGLLVELRRAGDHVPHALGGVPGRHPDRRLQRRDPDPVRVRHRAALERRRSRSTIGPRSFAGGRRRRGDRSALIALALVVFGITQRPATIAPAAGVALPGPVGTAASSAASPTSATRSSRINLLPFEITALHPDGRGHRRRPARRRFAVRRSSSGCGASARRSSRIRRSTRPCSRRASLGARLVSDAGLPVASTITSLFRRCCSSSASSASSSGAIRSSC